MESRGQQGELSCPTTCSQLQTQQEERHLISYTTLLPQWEEEKLSPPPATAQPMRDYHNPANEKPLYFKFPVSSVAFLFTAALPVRPPPTP